MAGDNFSLPICYLFMKVRVLKGFGLVCFRGAEKRSMLWPWFLVPAA